MNFFSPEGQFYKFMQTMTDILVITLLWMLFSLPLVTLGGATIAAFDVILKIVREEEGHVARQFVGSFKANFKNGIPFGLGALLCAYIVWLDFSLFEQIEGNPIMLLIAGIVAAFTSLLAFLYAFPLQARYENTFFRTLKNSVDISTRYFVRTLTLIVLLFAEVVFFCWNSTTQFLGFFLGPGCMMYTVSHYANYFFRQIEQEPGAVSNPEMLEE